MPKQCRLRPELYRAALAIIILCCGVSQVRAQKRVGPAKPTKPRGAPLAAPGAMNPSYITRDCVVAWVIRPQKLFPLPQVRAMPIDLLDALGNKHFGVDTSKLEEFIFLLGLRSDGPLVPAFIARFSEECRSKVEARFASVSKTADDFWLLPLNQQMAVYLPDDKTILVSHEEELVRMLDKTKPLGPLAEHFRRLDSAEAVSGILVPEPLRKQIEREGAELIAKAMPRLPEWFPSWLTISSDQLIKQRVTDVLRSLSAIEVHVRVEDVLKTFVELQCVDAKSSAEIKGYLDGWKKNGLPKLDAAIRKAAQSADADPVPSSFQHYTIRLAKDYLERLTYEVKGDRVVVRVEGYAAIAPGTAGAIGFLLWPPVQTAREVTLLSQSSHKLRQIGSALLDWHDQQGAFRPSTVDEQGKPRLSWRVEILPYLGPKEWELFKKFNCQEAWDHKENRELLKQMPDVYRNANLNSDLLAEGKTNFLMPVGRSAMFPNAVAEVKLANVTDAASQTILVVEVEVKHAVEWTKPDDLPFDVQNPLAGLGLYEGRFLALFANGSDRFISTATATDKLLRLFNPSDGQRVDLGD